MKLTRFKARIITGEGVETYSVYKTKERGLLVDMNGMFVSLNTLKEINDTCMLIKKKQRIRDNSILDWIRSLFMAFATVAIVTVPSLLIAII